MSLMNLWHKMAIPFTPIVTISYHIIQKNLTSSHTFVKIIRHHLFLPTLRQTLTRMICLHPLTIINLNHMNFLTEKLLSISFSNRKLIAIRIFLTLILQTTLQIPVLAHLKKNMKCSKIQYKIIFLLIHIH